MRRGARPNRLKNQARVSHTPGCRHSFAGALANNLVSKGLTARPKTVTRASDALLLLIELDAAEATVVSPNAARLRRRRRGVRGAACLLGWSAHCCMLAGLAFQRPARQAAERRCCLRVSPAASRQVRSARWCPCKPLRRARTDFASALLLRNARTCRSFGVRVIKPSPVLKACSPLLDHKDKSVRDGAKELAVRTQAPEFMPCPANRASPCFTGAHLRAFIRPGGAYPMARRSCGQARFHGQDARRAEEGGEHSPTWHSAGLAKPLLVFPPRCRSKRRWRPSSPMFVPCPLATCAKTRSAPRPGTLRKQTLSGLPARRCVLLYLRSSLQAI